MGNPGHPRRFAWSLSGKHLSVPVTFVTNNAAKLANRPVKTADNKKQPPATAHCLEGHFFAGCTVMRKSRSDDINICVSYQGYPLQQTGADMYASTGLGSSHNAVFKNRRVFRLSLRINADVKIEQYR